MLKLEETITKASSFLTPTPKGNSLIIGSARSGKSYLSQTFLKNRGFLRLYPDWRDSSLVLSTPKGTQTFGINDPTIEPIVRRSIMTCSSIIFDEMEFFLSLPNGPGWVDLARLAFERESTTIVIILQRPNSSILNQLSTKGYMLFQQIMVGKLPSSEVKDSFVKTFPKIELCCSALFNYTSDKRRFLYYTRNGFAGIISAQ